MARNRDPARFSVPNRSCKMLKAKQFAVLRGDRLRSRQSSRLGGLSAEPLDFGGWDPPGGWVNRPKSRCGSVEQRGECAARLRQCRARDRQDEEHLVVARPNVIAALLRRGSRGVLSRQKSTDWDP